MTPTTLRCVLVTGLAERLDSCGPTHPSLGALLDYGTYAVVESTEESTAIGAGAGAWSSHRLATAVEGNLAPLDLPLHPLDAAALTPEQLRPQLEDNIFQRPAAVWAVGAEGTALFVVAGPGAPSLGQRPPCPLQTTLRTVRWLRGHLEDADGTLFTEPTAGIDDPKLDERLRQLYGE